MGMFDYVDFVMDCPKCGEKVTDFQTKDKEQNLQWVHPREVENFYSSCNKCKVWIEFVKGWKMKVGGGYRRGDGVWTDVPGDSEVVGIYDNVAASLFNLPGARQADKRREEE